MVLKTEGNTYATLLHHPLLFKEKTTQAQEVARRISGAVAGEICANKSRFDLLSTSHFWRRCQGDLRQVKTYQVPIINSSPLHYIICHSPLIFLSPTSKTIFENLCLFFTFFPYVFLFVFPCAFYFLASFLAKNLLIGIHLKCFTWIIFDPYALVLKPQLA